MKKETIVSVICLSYNHENFIAEAIESFLMQKTNFKIEVLIHDDASTDQTAEIIRSYERKHPDIIKPIYQEENQHSKGVIVELVNYERAIGKYIALCEGDDYWTDPYKLQKQVDYMEAHPECSLSVHAAEEVDAESKAFVREIRPHRGDRLYSVEEVIEGGGNFFATNSILYSREKLPEMLSFYNDASVGDYPLVISLALRGTVHYMDDNMAAYRIAVKGSWTEREFSDINKKVKHYDEMAEMLDAVDVFTNYQYSNAIIQAKKRHQLYLLLVQGKFKEAKNGKYRKLYMEMGLKRRVADQVKFHFPKLTKIIKKIKPAPRRKAV